MQDDVTRQRRLRHGQCPEHGIHLRRRWMLADGSEDWRCPDPTCSYILLVPSGDDGPDGGVRAAA